MRHPAFILIKKNFLALEARGVPEISKKNDRSKQKKLCCSAFFLGTLSFLKALFKGKMIRKYRVELLRGFLQRNTGATRGSEPWHPTREKLCAEMAVGDFPYSRRDLQCK